MECCMYVPLFGATCRCLFHWRMMHAYVCRCLVRWRSRRLVQWLEMWCMHVSAGVWFDDVCQIDVARYRHNVHVCAVAWFILWCMYDCLNSPIIGSMTNDSLLFSGIRKAWYVSGIIYVPLFWFDDRQAKMAMMEAKLKALLDAQKDEEPDDIEKEFMV